MHISSYIKNLKNKRDINFLKTALKKGIKITVISENFRILKLEKYGNSNYMLDEKFFLNRKPSTLFTKNKEMTKLLLRSEKISVPHGIMAKNKKEALLLMKKAKITFPVVVKPIDMAKGMGVSVDIKNEKQFSEAVAKIQKLWEHSAKKGSGFFLVEEMVRGSDYRVLVLNNKVIACVQRIPASVTGDGKTTIKNLIKKFNSTRPEAYQIKFDREVLELLKKNSLTLSSVLKKDFCVKIRKNANISTGGRALDLTDKISARFKKIALRAFNALDLTYAGIDIMTEDIRSNSLKNKYWVIEINGAPDYDVHEKSIAEGKGVNTTDLLLDFFMKIH